MAALATSLICCVALTGCPGAAGGGGGDGDDVTTDRTFGGVRPPVEEVEARPQAINPFAANASVQLPSSADLTKDLPPIGDQGGIGSCTAWAAGYGAATYTAKRQYNWPEVGPTDTDHQASPGYLYERLIEVDAAEYGLTCGGGTLISTAMELLVQEGCSSMSVVGYSDQACAQIPSQTDAASFRVGSYNRVVETDPHAIRAELAAGRIVVFGTRLYDDFMNATGSDVYRGSGNFLMQGEMHAAHAMAVVGYDDSQQAYRIMNSWSTLWGDAGFLWMHYDTFHATAFEAYSIEPAGDREPPEPDPGPEPDPAPDPDAFIDEAYQFMDDDPITREPQVFLVFFYHFESPVNINTVTVIDPSGASAVQEWDTWTVDGYVYWVMPAEDLEATSGAVRHVILGQAAQFLPGVYTLILDVRTLEDEERTLSQAWYIAPLVPDDGGIDEGLCSDFCMFAYDGECDDGGPNSDWAVCEYGTDCFDCGVRDPQGGGGGDQLCFDTCRFANDGDCDDGGLNSDYDVCEYGTDCIDCGARDVEEQIIEIFCTDSCRFAFDGECDDGGLLSDWDLCEFGTDCFDCGERTLDDLDGGDVDIEVCTNFCQFAFDGECDDGSFDADWAVCECGSDCFDCGSRFLDECGFDESELCYDTCQTAFDGECDDGGLGSDWTVCECGTDCFDCGSRFLDECGFDDGYDGSELCDNTCQTAFDDECDDGGMGALWNVCLYGTDCYDCGVRYWGDPDVGIAKSSEAKTSTRTFRGIEVVAPPSARNVPAKALRPGLLGGNRKPAIVTPAPPARKNATE
jgi:hypothetical protein